MSCPVCPLKMTRAVVDLLPKACGPCTVQIKQMMAGFHGVMTEPQVKKAIWDNSAAYKAWMAQLTEEDLAIVHIKKSDDYLEQRCDIRDMKRIVGLPKFLELEKQVFTAWISEGQKDERIKEVLGLTYSQVFQLKKVIKYRLQKQMKYYRTIKKLEKEGKANG